MFKFFKEKLNSLFRKKSKEIVEEAEIKKEKEEKKHEIIKEIRELKEQEQKERKKEKIEQKIGEKKEEFEELKKEETIEKEKPEKKEGFFARLTKRFSTIRLEDGQFESFWNEFELLLIENNVALEVIDQIKEKLRKELIHKEIKKERVEEEVRTALKNAVSDLLLEPFDVIGKVKNSERPFIILFFGINGSGKTTTIAKLADLFLNKLSCVLAASDTFRAASIEQLAKHAENLGIKIIKHEYGADPAAVAFDAIAYAKTKKIDVVLIDTAGRMHTQANLLAEMKKIERVSRPNLKIFVGESITGNDAVEQAKRFNEGIGIDGIILTKADVDEKGGTSISVGYATGKPILYLGMGQEYGDLEKFDKERIIKSMGLE